MGLQFGIPRIILRASLRILFLRSVLASSFVCAAYSIWALLSLSFDKSVAAAVAFTVFTFAHHIANALGPKCIPLPVFLDLAVTLCEIGLYTFVFTLPRVWHYTTRSRWFPKRAVVALLCAWLLALALMGLFMLKILHVVRATCKGDFLRSRVDIAKSTEDPEGVNYRDLSVRHYFFKSIFGRKVWERRIPGGGKWIVVLRGILSFMVIIILVVYGFYQVTLMPISEMGMLPNKEFRASAIPPTFTSSVHLAWNLIMVWQRRPGAAKRLLDAATVEAIWRTNSTYRLEGPQCELIRDPFGQPTTTVSDPWSDPWVASQKSGDFISADYDVVVYRCPPRVEIKNPNSFQEYEAHRSDTRPDLELSVEFTELITPGEGLGTNGDVIPDSVQVYLGLSNRTHDTITTTSPTPLFPGLNLLSVASLAVRQRLEPAALSSLGFDIQKTFMIAEMSYMSNPFAPAVQPNVSTITAEFSDLTEWRIIQDFRDKSVLNGMSAVGGLGSLLNAFFSILLGTTLLRAIFRTRPFSILGLVHRLDSEIEGIHKACVKKYPKLQKELKDYSVEENKGITSLILDALLDIEVLKGSEPTGTHTTQKDERELSKDIEFNRDSCVKDKVDVSSVTTVVNPQDAAPHPNRQSSYGRSQPSS